VAPKRTQPAETPADLSPERAHPILKNQLAKLQELKGRDYREADATEDEWYNLTAKIVMRSFGSGSPNYRTFVRGRSAGQVSFSMSGHVDHRHNQQNFEARQQAYETALKSSISELELDLPEPEISEVYEPGQQYEFYRDVKVCLGTARKEIFVIDPYLNTEIFDVYASAIPRTVAFRLLSANVPADVEALAEKYAAGGNFAFRVSNSIHDRVLFADDRVWVTGQSWKDAAKKKPTYIIEHDAPLQRIVYEDVWNKAAAV